MEKQICFQNISVHMYEVFTWLFISSILNYFGEFFAKDTGKIHTCTIVIIGK
jgi:hypothetical protein